MQGKKFDSEKPQLQLYGKCFDAFFIRTDVHEISNLMSTWFFDVDMNSTCEDSVKDLQTILHKLMSAFNLSITDITKVLEFGANKYDAWNYMNGINYSRMFGAFRRHLLEADSSNNIDSESGLLHASHAACCLLFLIEFESGGLDYIGFDDRPDMVAKMEDLTAEIEVKEDPFANSEVEFYIAMMEDNGLQPMQEDIDEILRRQKCQEEKESNRQKKSQLGKCSTASILSNSVRVQETPSSLSRNQGSHTEASTSESVLDLFDNTLPPSKL